MIVAQLQDELGNILEQVGSLDGSIDSYLPPADDKTFRCVGFIDLYGETIFNSLQSEVLISELRMLLEKAEVKDRQYIEKLIAMTEKVKAGPHLYLRFSGD